LEAQGWTVVISTKKSKCGGQATTGGLAVDAHSSRIDTKFVGLLAEPLQCSEAVVQASRERVLRC
jgi:hypothetical protein